jgi:hypothetical protein
MSDEDSHEARAARGAERRREADAQEAARVRNELRAEKDRWRGFMRACAPWGWAFDASISYMIGFGFIMGLYCVMYFTFMFADVSFVGFFDALGPGSAGWMPLATIVFGIALPFVLRAIATPAANRATDTEEAWVAALPFPPPKLADVVRAYGASASRGGAKLRVSLYYEGGDRPGERAGALCHAASIPAAVSHHYSDELRIDMIVTGGSDFRVARKIRLLFHDLAVGVLAPLHKEAPFTRVELSS